MNINNLQIPALDGYLLSAMEIRPAGNVKGVLSKILRKYG
jgi:hypothetical protein